MPTNNPDDWTPGPGYATIIRLMREEEAARNTPAPAEPSTDTTPAADISPPSTKGDERMSRRRSYASRWAQAIDSRIARAIRNARQAAGLPHYEPKPHEVADVEEVDPKEQ